MTVPGGQMISMSVGSMSEHGHIEYISIFCIDDAGPCSRHLFWDQDLLDGIRVNAVFSPVFLLNSISLQTCRKHGGRKHP